MSELQRTRIVCAAAEILEEITVAQIVTRAGVSRKTFYEHFEDREGCFVAALEEAGADGAQETQARDLADGLGGRVTYRTLRVLAAVAEQPGASNCEIAQLAGIRDQGQISRLLGRLQGLGVVENSGVGQRRGEANAWRLTARGEEVRRAVERREGESRVRFS